MQPPALSYRAVAMLEILYATGLRVSDLCTCGYRTRCQPDSILVVGKGGRERLVPLGLAVNVLPLTGWNYVMQPGLSAV